MAIRKAGKSFGYSGSMILSFGVRLAPYLPRARNWPKLVGSGAAASQLIAKNVDGDSSQPSTKAGLGRIKGAYAADGDKPGFLDNFLGQLADATAAPGYKCVQALIRGVIPNPPGLLVTSKNGTSQSLVTPDSVFARHDDASMAAATS
jgi:hypothetical protein